MFHGNAQRLPKDFEPFFAIDTRRRLGEGRGASTYDEGEGPEGRATGLAFRLAFAVFSSRAWDGLYLLLGLLWSVLCPGYLDGAMGVERAQLASLLLVMFALVAAPVMAATILKSLCYTELRSRLRGNTRSTVREVVNHGGGVLKALLKRVLESRVPNSICPTKLPPLSKKFKFHST